MALTELQLPTKDQLYSVLQSAANKMNNIIKQWEDLTEFIDLMDSTDLDALSVPSNVRTDLTEFKAVMAELTDFFNGTSTTQSYVPAVVIDKIRSI